MYWIIPRSSFISNIYLIILLLLPKSSVFSSQIVGPSTQPEAYFDGSAYLRLLTIISLKTQTAFSFKTCKGGELFSQIHNDNIIELSVNLEGLEFLVKLGDKKYEEIIEGEFLDNSWHTVNILYKLGNLTLTVDSDESRLLANSSYRQELLTSPSLYNEGAVSIFGKHFVGCLMEGPSVTFDPTYIKPHNVQFGMCPIPEDSCIVKQDLKVSPADFCITEPCMRHGTCKNALNTYTCVCLPRYTGKNCEFELGNPCDKKPPLCKNGATCLDDNGGNYKCNCPPNYTGKHCELDYTIHPLCSPNPCQSGGSCLASGSILTDPPFPTLITTMPTPTVECLCPPGYSGPRCETNINECAAGPCLHRGTCVDGPNNYTCVCGGTGYAGRHCEVNVNECLEGGGDGGGGPCLNRGVCYDTHGGFICHCPHGYGGDNCELVLNECMSQPCRNQGQCEERLGNGGGNGGNSGGPSYECHCLPGYLGANCELESRHGLNQCDNALCSGQADCREVSGVPTCVCKPEYTGEYPNCSPSTICQTNPCLNGGICSPFLGRYNCSCPLGFTGVACERQEFCKETTCRNGGTCIADIFNFRCVCPDNVTGRYCEKRLSCADEPCDHAVNCHDYLSGYYCTCEAGWSGNNCDHNVNDCLISPCLNGATCLDQLDDFSCQCVTGYAGERCQINIDDCVTLPCKNGGICTDKINGFECNCTDSWMGTTCEKPYDVCELKPCFNDANCVSAVNKHEFTCNCLPGFEGTYCEVNIDDCTGVTCPVGKVCADLVGTYECKCPDGLMGDSCSIEMNPCEKEPCSNNATCEVSNIAPNYTCSCTPGFTGFLCDTDINECELPGVSICNNGICVNNNGSFDCYCKPGYTGERCNLDFDECLSMPCQNGALCHNKINNYDCECPQGYAGKDCSINIDECDPNPCTEGSTCIDGINEFTCICVPGLTGVICEINIDDCMSSPCLHDAPCLDGLNTYRCDCSRTGYTGTHCHLNIDDCVSAPCQHDGRCVDAVLDYRCECHRGYTGKDCEEDVDECASGPCQHGGTCLEASNATLYGGDGVWWGEGKDRPERFSRGFSYDEAYGFECLCVPGVTGVNCETNVNECESQPCFAGTCSDRIGRYHCDCEEGFEGEQCEIDIDECALYRPCVHGDCLDRRATYACECHAGYGGQNCSVALTGCVSSPCLNNGTCAPYLAADHTTHLFNCSCPTGYRGATCDVISTMSLSGASLVTVNTSRDEGYDIQFRFKTTLGDGVLALGRGLTFYILELSRGRLNLHSSLLNKWEGVFVGSHLNDSRWQRVFVAINASHLVLSANDEQTIYPITFSENSNVSSTSFPTTYIGGYPNNLRKLTHGHPFLVGCTEDVVINGEWVLPEQQQSTTSTLAVPPMSFYGVEVGCGREPQCSPNPCHSGGHCTDRWRNFSCTCERPYLGQICQYNYTAATFGYENTTNSLVTVTVTDAAKRAVRSIVDISMFVRTRQLRGQIFYLGSALASGNLYNESYIAAQLENGELFVRIQFNGTVEAYTVGGLILSNGYNHLIEVIRNVTLVQVKINGTEYFRKTISASGTLDAHVLYLGGQPQLRAVRQTTETDIVSNNGSNVTTGAVSAVGAAAAAVVAPPPSVASVVAAVATPAQLTSVHFKGIIQDVQISDGSKTMVVEFFPLQPDEIKIPLPFGNVSFDHNTVLEGVLSDDSCHINPCHHNGVCVNTWNDYRCECTRGFKGKDCKELEFCKFEQCPSGSECQNLEVGYECVANATFDGDSPPLTYTFDTAPGIEQTVQVDTIEVTYRTRSWGTVLFAKHLDNYLTIFIHHDEVVVEWNLLGQVDTYRFKREHFDGQWVTILLKGKDAILKGGFKDLVNDDTPNFIVTDFDAANFTSLFTLGVVYVAGSDGQTFDYGAILANGKYNNSSYVTLTSDLQSTSSVDMNVGNAVDFTTDMQYPSYKVDLTKSNDMFKGCLGEIRIATLLLPYFTNRDIYSINSTTLPEEFYSMIPPEEPERAAAATTTTTTSGYRHHTGCTLCEDRDCYHGGRCVDPLVTYRCDCPVGYRADDCSYDVDECLESRCENGARCADLVGRYECECVAGFQGEFCEKEIDECESNPCHHGGTCIDLLATFRCECPEDYVGKQCEALRLITCENQPCKEGATCSNIKNEDYPDTNFTCICTEGMSGRLCDVPFCSRQHCLNGGNCNVTVGLPPRCQCARGYEGRLCEVDIDDCVLVATGGSPCQNGGVCMDGVNRYDCNCTETGFTGLLCEMDIDECGTLTEPCGPGQCDNILGSYLCHCPLGMCGHYCRLEDPCLVSPCSNGVCTHDCREQPNYICECENNWTGKNCTVNALLKAAEEVNGLNILYIAIPIVAIILVGVGIALAVLINVARSKRATRGTYSPSAQEFCNPRVELDHVLKPPPEERLI